MRHLLAGCVLRFFWGQKVALIWYIVINQIICCYFLLCLIFLEMFRALQLESIFESLFLSQQLRSGHYLNAPHWLHL